MLVYKSTPFFLKNNAPGCNYLNIVIPPHQVGGQVWAIRHGGFAIHRF